MYAQLSWAEHEIFYYQHAPVFFCRTGICQTQDIFLREIRTKTIYIFLILVQCFIKKLLLVF